jgi:predicted phage terminase large subunit-like protein
VKLSARLGNARLLVEATRDGIAITSALKKINANLPFHMVPAQGDKFARSQAVAAAWNEGRVRVPEVAGPWRREFLEEVYAFTGIADRHDDQVDALAHAWNYALAQRTGAGVTPPVSSAQPRFSPSQRAWG